MPFETLIIALLSAVTCGLIILGILIIRRRREVKGLTSVDLANLSDNLSNRIRDDLNKAVRDTISETSKDVGSISSTLKMLDESLEKAGKELPEGVKGPVKEVLTQALKELGEVNKNLINVSDNLPRKILTTIQGSISPKKGKVGELATLMRILGTYERIIPLGHPVDFIGISDEYIDFIETKAGEAGLSREEKRIKELIDKGNVRFILRREEVEISPPVGEIEELMDEFSEGVRQGFPSENVDFIDGSLFEKLRGLRKEIAREENLPQFVILHDSVLKEIAIKRPTTEEELAQIRGIGSEKFKKYGERILKVVAKNQSQ
jgi:predicted Holliday junction resolvase-like endonuclease